MARFRQRTRTDYIVVHYSATPPSMDIGVDEIRKWHVEERGWDDIGYHYVIRRDGSIEIGRHNSDVSPWERDQAVGAHVAGWNARSVGVCLVGGVDDRGRSAANFTNYQWDSLKALVQALKMKYPDAEVLGHRDFPGTTTQCPGFDVRDWYKREVESAPFLFGGPVDEAD